MAVRAVTGTLTRPAKQIATTARLGKWVVQQYPTQGLLAAPALVARILPGAPGRALVGAINMRQRSKNRSEIVPYIDSFYGPRTSFNGRSSSRREFTFAEMDLAEVKAVGKAYGTTLNNVVVAVCAGAVRRYMEDHGGVSDIPIVVCCPVSLRHEKISEPWANHVHMMFAPFPVHEADPIARLEAVTRDLKRAKDSFDGMPIYHFRELSRFIPRDFFAWLVQLWIRLPDRFARAPWNVVVSNVRGPVQKSTMNGAVVAGYWPASFISIGGGINITLQSYVDKICFGFVGTPEKVGDLWPLVDYMHDALDELRDAVNARVEKQAQATTPAAGADRPARKSARASGTSASVRKLRASGGE